MLLLLMIKVAFGFEAPSKILAIFSQAKNYVGYALVQSISINRASSYALYCGTFHAAQDNIIINNNNNNKPTISNAP